MAILEIAITKAGNKTLSVETDKLDEAVYTRALAEGLKVLLNAGQSKIAAASKGDDASKAAAFAKAEETLAKCYDGSLPAKRGTKSADTGVSRQVQTEAMRLARMVIKDELRAAGVIPSRVEASTITAAAKAYLETDEGKTLIAQAEENLASRPKAKVADAAEAQAKLAALGITGESPKLVAKANEKAAERKQTLSKTQAGKVAPRAKAAQQASAH